MTISAEPQCPPVTVSRRISADAADIFAVLADPRRHTEIDGSEMLRGAITESVVTGVGDVFVLKMYLERLGGDYEMENLVVDFEPDRRITWEPKRHDVEEASGHHRWGYELVPDGQDATIVTESFDCSRWPADDQLSIEYGRIWIDAMTASLERLDKLCAR